MKTKFNGLLTLLLALVVQLSYAQEKTISGIVSDESGPLPGVTVLKKGTTKGTETDFDGKYSILAKSGDVLVFSFVGMETIERIIGTANTINVVMASDNVLDEVVVTSLGIKRAKKSLGYSSQEVGGKEVSTVRLDNVVNSLSGKVSGVQIKANNNFGGSANFLIRGVSSLTGNNQPLFVIDGIPMSNRINNTANQAGGGKGYDYGNAASDINPDDVESINILKGAAASAIYGSRGANGVVIITTKRGKSGVSKINVASSTTIGAIDRSTFLEYQDKYGAGYGPYYGSTGYFEDIDVNGDGTADLAVPTYDDASYGAPLDGSLVYQWDSFVPEHRNYQKATPYLAGNATPADFFETSFQYNNSIAFTGGNDKMTYRLGYTNFDATGMLPNSKINKNTFNMNGTLKVNDKIDVGANGTFIVQRTKGRNSTGYSDNLMSQFRQWWQVNVDIDEQRKIYEQTEKNYSWNHEGALPGGKGVLQPHYWDNPYWTRYRNFQTDRRNRFVGNVFATYTINDWLSATGKASVDTYTELREERRANGSVATAFGILGDSESSGYDRKDVKFSEYNYDLMFNFSKDLTEDLSLNGVAGINVRRETYDFLHQSTAGGLTVPEFYALSNSKNPNPKPIEILNQKQVNGYYIQGTFGYKDMVYFDFTDRYDVSSALPEGNNAYNYFALSSSFIFSELMRDVDWLSFGKVRAGYAEVGNDLPANNVFDTFATNNNFGDSALFSFPGTKQNSDLVPERTKEIELGLESRLFNNKVALDFTWYRKRTENQLMPVQTTASTGFTRRWVNAGTIQNKGIEIGLKATPISNDNFSWNIAVNWAKNENLVMELYGDQENLVLNSFQGGISVNATVGQPYGTIRGTGFKYHENGQKIVDDSGYYVAVADQVIGNANPEWTGGLQIP
ncbi:SusC/RagA family TonB-linked outer membrane protein [Tenacibaculum sp. MAR_2009_124]|uniref:SusC/RagA family TonB-linked outer membrane protein n=1 Tax=Tenacibaculum sp. MAR_2009_124 TaxID=1250059 RepID=UPI000A9EB061|nr:SusC/RagA family TonB-linked outer membrane protein [Tenacibaculum sp. MAR_2009_124]